VYILFTFVGVGANVNSTVKCAYGPQYIFGTTVGTIKLIRLDDIRKSVVDRLVEG